MRLLFSLCLLVFCESAIALTTISGSAPKFLNDSVTLSAIDSRILQIYAPLTTVHIDAQGRFKFELNSISSGMYRLSIQNYHGDMYIEDGASYQVALEPSDSKSPIYKKKKLYVEVQEEPASKVNKNAPVIMALVDSFVYAHGVKGQKNSSKKLPWDSLAMQLNNRYQPYKSAFLNDFIKTYTGIAEYQLHGNRSKVFQAYLQNRFNPSNDIHFMLYYLMYNDFMSSLKAQDLDSAKRWVKIPDLSKLKTLIQQTDTNRGLPLDWISVNLALRLYTKKQIDLESLTLCLARIHKESSDLVLRSEIEALQKASHQMEVGSFVEPFALSDGENSYNPQHLSQDKYTYFLAAATWCKSCLQDMIIANDLQKKYADILEVRIISFDENKEGYQKLKAMYPLDSQLKVLYFNHDFNGLRNWKIQTLPYSYLVDPKGQIVQVQSLPSEKELELLLAKIQSAKKEKQIKNKPFGK